MNWLGCSLWASGQRFRLGVAVAGAGHASGDAGGQVVRVAGVIHLPSGGLGDAIILNARDADSGGSRGGGLDSPCSPDGEAAVKVDGSGGGWAAVGRTDLDCNRHDVAGAGDLAKEALRED